MKYDKEHFLETNIRIISFHNPDHEWIVEKNFGGICDAAEILKQEK